MRSRRSRRADGRCATELPGSLARAQWTPPGEGVLEDAPVEVLDRAARRKAAREARHDERGIPRRLEGLEDLPGGRLALRIRVRAEDHLPDRTLLRAAHEAADRVGLGLVTLGRERG